MRKRKVIHQATGRIIKRSKLKLIEAGGGVLYRKKGEVIQVLIIKRNGNWDLPKGKLENHETIEECAVREVAEEVGVQAPVIDAYLCETYHEYIEKGSVVGKKTKWYSMKQVINTGLEPQQEEGITQLKWIDPEDAITLMGFENLKKVLKTFLSQLSEK